MTQKLDSASIWGNHSVMQNLMSPQPIRSQDEIPKFKNSTEIYQWSFLFSLYFLFTSQKYSIASRTNTASPGRNVS